MIVKAIVEGELWRCTIRGGAAYLGHPAESVLLLRTGSLVLVQSYISPIPAYRGWPSGREQPARRHGSQSEPLFIIRADPAARS